MNRLRPLLWGAAGVLLAGLIAGPSGATGEVALAYDQIERVLPGDAVVPAPDDFELDEQQTRAAIAQQPGGRRGFSRVVGSLGRRGPGDALTALTDDLRADGYPRLERHVFYRGWERIENLVTGTIVLRMCDRSELVTIDPARKTYRIADPLAADRAAAEQRAARDRPGAAALELARTIEPAAPLSAGGVAAQVYRSEETVRTADASGSCRETAIDAQTQTYYAAQPAPVVLCPRPAPDFPATPLTAIARDGCRPTVAARITGPAEPSWALVLYRAVTLAEGRDRLVLLTARGNIGTIPDAAQLFEVPPGYAKVP